MELLEAQDPEKRKLIETSDRHKRELEKELNGISQKTERLLTNALIIGGSLALTYFVISRFTGSAAKKKKARSKIDHVNEEEGSALVTPATPSWVSQIGTKVINQATLILLDMAREKLEEYLNTRKESNENS